MPRPMASFRSAGKLDIPPGYGETISLRENSKIVQV